MKPTNIISAFLLLPQVVLASEGDLPHGIRPDVEIGFRHLNEILWAAGILAVALLAWFLYKKLKNRDGEGTSHPEEAINERIRRELTLLAKMELTDSAQIKDFYFRLSEASRKILELLGIGSVEQTFEEFKPLLEVSNEFPTYMKDEISTVLERSEMVKFAKHVPNVTVCEDDLALCFRQLDRYEVALKEEEERVKEEISLIEQTLKSKKT